METTARAAAIAGHDAQQIERANRTGLQPVVFVHGWRDVADESLTSIRRDV